MFHIVLKEAEPFLINQVGDKVWDTLMFPGRRGIQPPGETHHRDLATNAFAKSGTWWDGPGYVNEAGGQQHAAFEEYFTSICVLFIQGRMVFGWACAACIWWTLTWLKIFTRWYVGIIQNHIKAGLETVMKMSQRGVKSWFHLTCRWQLWTSATFIFVCFVRSWYFIKALFVWLNRWINKKNDSVSKIN